MKEEIIDINNNLNNFNSDILVINKKIELLKGDIDNISSKSSDLLFRKNNYNNMIIKNNRDIDSLKYRIQYLEDSINNNSLVPKQIKMILDNPKYNRINNLNY